MFVSTNYKIFSLLGLAAAASSAPLNERTNAKRGVVGWLCHYEGPSSPLVDTSLDLPTLLGALCAKVNYDFTGCESFDPNPVPVVPSKSPEDNGTGIQSASVDQDEDEDNDDHKKPKHEKGQGKHPSNKHPSNKHPSNKHSSNKHPSNKHPKQSKSSSHHHNGGDDDENPVNAHSFHGSDDDEPASPHNPHGKGKPHKTSSEKDHNSSVGSLSNGESDDDDAHGCQPNEYYSPDVDRCVDQSYFSSPQSDGTCKEGILDALIDLCLDVSTLGLTDPIHAEVAVMKLGSGANGNQKCPQGQQYSSLLSICFDDVFFSEPLAGGRCDSGWKLDLVLGNCFDFAGCQDHGNQS